MLQYLCEHDLKLYLVVKSTLRIFQQSKPENNPVFKFGCSQRL